MDALQFSRSNHMDGDAMKIIMTLEEFNEKLDEAYDKGWDDDETFSQYLEKAWRTTPEMEKWIAIHCSESEPAKG